MTRRRINLDAEIRRIPLDRPIAAMWAIPAARRHVRESLRDGADALFELGLGDHCRLRVALAVSSGGEIVVPALLRDELPAIGARRNVTEATLDLCTHRPLQLVPGLQDTALASITEQLAQGSAWDRTTPREREEIALRLQIERARAAGVDVETIMEEGK